MTRSEFDPGSIHDGWVPDNGGPIPPRTTIPQDDVGGEDDDRMSGDESTVSSSPEAEDNKKLWLALFGAVVATIIIVMFTMLIGGIGLSLVTLSAVLLGLAVYSRITNGHDSGLAWAAWAAAIMVPTVCFITILYEANSAVSAFLISALMLFMMLRSYRAHAVGRSAPTVFAVGSLLAANLAAWVEWGWIGIVIGVAAWIGALIMWKLFNPPDLKSISDQIDWEKGLKLRWSVRRFGRLPTDYKEVLACDRRHWMMIFDESPARIIARVITLIISILVMILGWKYLPIWAAIGISLFLFLFSMQKVIAWLFKVVLVLEDEDGGRRLVLAPTHPFSRQILNVRETDLKAPVVIQTTVGTLLGYSGYELGTLNERTDKNELRLRFEFRRLPADSRSTILIGNF